ncbi:hypothetical protein QUF75_17270 [Desulfococcaceae bacterium HSG7]|nr:hypothetical protein [Desulfococcaceae bacterium HSG7]
MTQSIRFAFPRKAWERETWSAKIKRSGFLQTPESASLWVESDAKKSLR